jgi:hypothetical protein
MVAARWCVVGVVVCGGVVEQRDNPSSMASNVDTTGGLPGENQTAPLVFFRADPVLYHYVLYIVLDKMFVSPCCLASRVKTLVRSTDIFWRKEGHRVWNYFLTCQILQPINGE